MKLNCGPPETAHIIKFIWCLGGGEAAPCGRYSNVPVFNWPSMLKKSLGDVPVVKHLFSTPVLRYSVALLSESSSSLSVGTGVCVSHSIGSSLPLTVVSPLIAARHCSSCFWVGAFASSIFLHFSPTCFCSSFNSLI